MFLLSLAVSAYCVVLVVQRSSQPEAESSFYRQNEVTLVMGLIGAVVPKVFGLLELLEAFHPRKAMQYMLTRISKNKAIKVLILIT